MQTILVNFRSSLQRVRNIADDALANTPQAMRIPALRERHETTLSAVVVIMTGFFESFMRDVAENYSDFICQQNQPFRSLKPKIRFTHFQGGGKILTNIGGKKPSPRYSWTPATALDVAKRLASVDAGPGYQLVWEAFAETGGNPGSEVIADFLRRFGVHRPIETLASNVFLPPYDPGGTGVNLSPTLLSTMLDSFIAIRNECAHTGQATNTPTASDVIGYCDLLEAIAAGIVATLTAHQFY